ncbi:GmrSD restriction endonuclease domain-containing protein [Microbulbifer sp. PAAF003]|uniref:GmrSD restriction endonuclease domain-containing protein n=1 Tax=Microbulbifer sp. PAAF003 TaxID=3243375 RepID=UPI004039C19C
MKISTILDHIDSGHMALPEFQRGYVWNRDQVRGLVWSLYHRYPVGSLLVWATESSTATHRGDQALAAGVVKLLLDGQQRMTSLYGLIRGVPPQFFDGDAKSFTGLYFNMDSEELSFYMPTKMQGNPLWVNVTELLKGDMAPLIQRISSDPELAANLGIYIARLNQLQGIRDIEVHVEEVTGKDKTIDVVVDIFNKVNSGGTKLSKGDLALAKICSEEPQARALMRAALDTWEQQGFSFKLDWLLRNINAIATGEARFSELDRIGGEEFLTALKQGVDAIDYLLNVIGARLGLDHHQVLFGYYGFPVLARFLREQGGSVSDEQQLNKMLFWFVHSALWGRYSGSTESVLGRDLDILANPKKGLDGLIHELKLWRGGLRILPENFTGWSRGTRFYAMLYLLTRVGEAMDWGLNIPLKKGLLGQNSSLEVHHIFPRALLKKHGYDKTEINAIANFCFLTKNTNIKISDSAPEVYFEEIEKRAPGALASQWIPLDRELWKVENYPRFLEKRRELLAEAANNFLDSLYTLDAGSTAVRHTAEVAAVLGGIDSVDEQQLLDEIRGWLLDSHLPQGELEYELVDTETGELLAVLDLAWPEGFQTGLSEPVALLIDEPAPVAKAASGAGFRVFEDVKRLKSHVAQQILGDHLYGLPQWASLVDRQILPVVHRLLEAGVAEPECGYELQGEGSEVIAEFELAWPQKKVGVWTARGADSDLDLLPEGWLVFTQAEATESPDLLLAPLIAQR